MFLYLIQEARDSISYYPILFLVLIIYIITIRKEITGIFDPFILTISTHVFSGALVLWLYFNGHIIERYMWLYVICSTTFLIGLIIPRIKSKRNKQISRPTFIVQSAATENSKAVAINNEASILTFILLILNIVVLLYAIANKSVAILSDDPLLDRVMVRASNRWVTILISALAPLILTLGFYLWTNARKTFARSIAVLAIAIGFVNFATMGSKGAILSAVGIIGSLQAYYKFSSRNYPVSLRVFGQVIVVAGFVYLIYVIALSTDANWFDVLSSRLVGSGDTYIYLFVEKQYEELKYTYNLVTYLLHTITTSFGLKFITYNIGTALYGGSTSNYSGFGPNPQHVGEGLIFFGDYFAPIYSLCIGFLISFSRRVFRRKNSLMGFIAFIILFNNAGIASIDIVLWQFNIIASILVIFFPFILSRIITRSMLRKHSTGPSTLPSLPSPIKVIQ